MSVAKRIEIELDERLRKAKQEVSNTWYLFNRLKPIYEEAKNAWFKAKLEYEHLDRLKSFEDGRFKKVEKKKDFVAEMTEEQLIEIAKRLGIKVESKNES
jgi:hypothetical protein